MYANVLARDRNTFHEYVYEELSGADYCPTNEGGEENGSVGGYEEGAWVFV